MEQPKSQPPGPNDSGYWLRQTLDGISRKQDDHGRTLTRLLENDVEHERRLGKLEVKAEQSGKKAGGRWGAIASVIVAVVAWLIEHVARR